MKCWGYWQCGREDGGVNVETDGRCPAAEQAAGEACWLVAGTFCGGKLQGTRAEKERNCMRCEFYNRFDLAHRCKVRRKFG